MRAKLGVNAGFAINRFPEPEDWLQIVGEQLGLHYVQFVADLLNPFLPAEIVSEQAERIRRGARQYGITIESCFTSAFTRVNHMAHPDPKIQRVWVDWFRRYADLARELGAQAVGSHFGIMSMADSLDPVRRERVTAQCIDNWHALAEYCNAIGLRYLMFEPMSVPREFAATIDATQELYTRVNRGSALPILLCLDVDHGDLQSKDPRDTDPYAWLTKFAAVSPAVHIKQSSSNKSGHWPFTPERNKQGIIRPERVLDALREGGASEVTLLLELNFRERFPAEYTVVNDLKQSVAYWRPYVKE
jgi:sugar phosphate isomerase/epimerase